MTTQLQHEWRRNKIMDLLSQGETNQSEIARILQVDRSLVCRDVAYLTEQSKQNIRNYGDRLSFEFDKAIHSLDIIQKKAAIIADNQHVDQKVQLSALSLCKDIAINKLDILTNVNTISQVMDFIDKSNQKLNSNSSSNQQQQEEEYDDNNNEINVNDEEIQQQQQNKGLEAI